MGTAYARRDGGESIAARARPVRTNVRVEGSAHEVCAVVRWDTRESTVRSNGAAQMRARAEAYARSVDATANRVQLVMTAADRSAARRTLSRVAAEAHVHTAFAFVIRVFSVATARNALIVLAIAAGEIMANVHMDVAIASPAGRVMTAPCAPPAQPTWQGSSAMGAACVCEGSAFASRASVAKHA
mmetsp:Transcript_63091/g.104901  ORF Transcript_63091/g.104901 Transcript_63091/m.104901 type:complete len:186 (+) Transcript_63091:96-653(+)